MERSNLVTDATAEPHVPPHGTWGQPCLRHRIDPALVGLSHHQVYTQCVLPWIPHLSGPIWSVKSHIYSVHVTFTIQAKALLPNNSRLRFTLLPCLIYLSSNAPSSHTPLLVCHDTILVPCCRMPRRTNDCIACIQHLARFRHDSPTCLR